MPGDQRRRGGGPDDSRRRGSSGGSSSRGAGKSGAARKGDRSRKGRGEPGRAGKGKGRESGRSDRTSGSNRSSQSNRSGATRSSSSGRQASSRGRAKPTDGFGPFASGKGAAQGGDRRRRSSAADRAKTEANDESSGLQRRSRLRIKGAAGTADSGRRAAAPASTRKARSGGPGPGERRAVRATGRRPRRPRKGSPDVRAEILRLGGRHGNRLYTEMTAAADEFAQDHAGPAVRILAPLRDALPESPSVRELLGLSLYRLGRYRAAAKELDRYAALADAVDQHPVLMDCQRALGRHRKVAELWEELAAVSPSAALVTEGRIVRAGDLADQGRLDSAIRLLDRRAGPLKRPRDHHVRLWYALADIEERAGNVPRARELFRRVERYDRSFADVAERLAALR